MPGLIQHYFPKLTERQQQQFAALPELYSDWNSKINVISRKDIEHLEEKHVLHSLAIFKFIDFQPGTDILDIGTGGGFPGIPLAIMMPGVNFVLADSIGKKIKVVNAVAESLGLKNVVGIHSRAEDIKQKFDFVVSRAVAELPLLIAWSRGKFKSAHKNAIPNGLICLKGGDLGEEMKNVREAQVFEVGDYFGGEYFGGKKILYIPMA